MQSTARSFLVLLLFLGACDSPTVQATGDAAGHDGGMPIDAASTDGAPPIDVDGGRQACAPFGHWPAPTTTFEITEDDRNGEGGLYYPDVVAAFPEVDWATLDRLYVHAGTYSYIHLGNLPDRTVEHPLVITNRGGQVHVGPAPSAAFGYLWIMDGGSNWVLTGRYDPDAQTGDVGFQGHRCGAYASSADTYGFVSDDELQTATTEMNHMGINVSADAFELEYLEIRRSSFAGIRISKANVTVASGEPAPEPFVDVSIHDLYMHDLGGEGLYFGSTSGSADLHAAFVRLHLYNNRIIRAGNEVAQLQQLGEGSEIDHNVFAFGAMNWRNAFQEHQDNGSQHHFRQGDVDVHHNVYLRGMESLLNFFGAPEPGDVGGEVAIRDNYFSDAMWLGIYFGGPGATEGTALTYRFENNVFRNLEATDTYGYFAEPYYPERVNETTIVRFGTTWTAPVTFVGNRWTGTRTLAFRPPAFLTDTDNEAGATIPAIEFAESGLPSDVPYLAYEFWVPHTGNWATGGVGPVTYAPGAMVFDMGHLYRCIAATAAGDPAPSVELGGRWEDLGAPADDYRLAAGSPHTGVGLLDTL